MAEGGAVNPRNVAALRAMTAEWGARLDRGEATDGLPEFLAARGVLVPSAMDAGECQAVHEASTDYYDRGCFLEVEFRAALERIAKGEGA